MLTFMHVRCIVATVRRNSSEIHVYIPIHGIEPYIIRKEVSNMKKFMAMLLTLVMALSLVACGQKADDTKKDDAADTDDSLVVLENVVDWGETEPYRVLVQKGDPKGLLPGINKAIAELTANDGALIKEI